MKLFHKSKVKNQILKNIVKSTDIEKQIQQCFAPMYSMIWCHSIADIDIHNASSDDIEFIDRLNRNLPSFKENFESLLDLYDSSIKISHDFPDLQEFTIDSFKMRLNNIYRLNNSIISDIKNLYDYKTTSSLKRATTILEEMREYVQKTAHYVNTIANVEY